MVTFILVLLAIILVPIALTVIISAWPLLLILGIIGLVLLVIMIFIAYPPLFGWSMVILGGIGYLYMLQDKKKERQLKKQNADKIAQITE